MRRDTLFSFVSLLAITVAAAPAAAQVTGDTDQPAAEADEGIETVTVTAQRREESLQDVPVSVAVVPDETVAAINSGGADIRGLAGRVPSLNIESSFGRTFPRFYIRGSQHRLRPERLAAGQLAVRRSRTREPDP
jgi:iron complex outermembrane receptor protein